MQGLFTFVKNKPSYPRESPTASTKHSNALSYYTPSRSAIGTLIRYRILKSYKLNPLDPCLTSTGNVLKHWCDLFQGWSLFKLALIFMCYCTTPNFAIQTPIPSWVNCTSIVLSVRAILLSVFTPQYNKP